MHIFVVDPFFPFFVFFFHLVIFGWIMHCKCLHCSCSTIAARKWSWAHWKCAKLFLWLKFFDLSNDFSIPGEYILCINNLLRNSLKLELKCSNELDWLALFWFCISIGFFSLLVEIVWRFFKEVYSTNEFEIGHCVFVSIWISKKGVGRQCKISLRLWHFVSFYLIYIYISYENKINSKGKKRRMNSPRWTDTIVESSFFRLHCGWI